MDGDSHSHRMLLDRFLAWHLVLDIVEEGHLLLLPWVLHLRLRVDTKGMQ